MITVIFHVAYTYISSKFLVKRPSSFIIKKCLLWRLRDFSSIANLAGIPVAEPKSDLKIQKFISNDEEWRVKLHFWYKKYHLKIALHFWRYLFMKTPMFLRYSLRYEGFKLVKSFPFWSYIWHYSLSCYYFLLERKNHFYKVISAGRGHFELLGIPLLDCFHSKQKVTCTRGLNLTFCFKNEILLPFLTLSYLKEYLENIGFLWANFSKNVTRFLSGIFL